MINNVTVIGRITRDPELKYSSAGTSMCAFSIAYNEKRNGEDVSMFFDCVTFGGLAENIVKYVKKGHLIGVSGKLDQNKWVDKDGNNRNSVNIVVNEAQFLGGKSE